MAATGADPALPTPAGFERAGLRAWPGIEVEWDGNWVRRAAGGHTKRANSAQCFDPTDDEDVERRVSAARAWFEARKLPAVFRVNPLTGPRLAAELNRQGWRTIDRSSLMATALAPLEADPRAELLAVDDPAFAAAQQQLKHWDAATRDRFEAILAVIDVPASGVVLRDEAGRVVSSALMVVADGIVITGSVVTATASRQRGYANGVMRTGLGWAREAGAAFAALNVEQGNEPALALYGRLGYRHLYDYAYRVPGDR